MTAPLKNADPLWFKDAIIYELSVRAFYDSNGDGIGDFQGIIEKLDYLEDLGNGLAVHFGFPPERPDPRRTPPAASVPKQWTGK